MLALALCTTKLHATATPLIPTFTPTGAVSLTYQLPGTPGSSTSVSLATAAVATAPAGSTFYTVDPTTVPYWLTVSVSSGTVVSPITAGSVAGTPSVFTLVASGVAATLAAGVYTGTVQLDVIGDTALNIPVTLVVKAPSATLSVTGGTSVLTGKTWAIGATQVPFTFTLVSSDQPISFTTTIASLTSTGTTFATGMTASPASGIVYTWGSTITITLNPIVYAKAQAGDVISGLVTVNYGASSTIALTFGLTVTPPAAAITSIFPTAVPLDTVTTDTVNIVITGSGFVPAGLNEQTAVFVGGTQLVTGFTVVNTTTIVVGIPVTANNFKTKGNMAIAVLNPNGGTGLSAPTSGSDFINLVMTALPIINAVTSAATYIESGAAAQFAPYDLVSIFGNNLCPDCGGNVTTVPDSTFYRYPLFVHPDGTHYMQVQFNQHSDTTLVAQGYILFANNTQINVLVPAALAPGLIGTGTVDVVVSYGVTVPPAVPLGTESSAAYTVGMVAADPGILTSNSDGVGQGAILNADFSLNTQANPGLKTTGTAIVYMTGLGAPTSAATNLTTATALSYPASCITALGTSGYMATVNALGAPPSPVWTSVDGAIIQSALIFDNGTEHYAPCMGSVTATINAVTATVTYAGWVADSVAGLYQVNLTIPTAAGTGTSASVPVVVTFAGKSSQAGVTMWVK